MSQTKEGAQKAKATMIEKYGLEHWKRAGAIGGTKSRGGGFGEGEVGRARAVKAGKIGGLRSKRGKSKKVVTA